MRSVIEPKLLTATEVSGRKIKNVILKSTHSHDRALFIGELEPQIESEFGIETKQVIAAAVLDEGSHRLLPTLLTNRQKLPPSGLRTSRYLLFHEKIEYIGLLPRARVAVTTCGSRWEPKVFEADRHSQTTRPS